jgi:2-dehydro-3-deoxyphosphogluconate aldolase/(4S)-4-hydroxy-2-oxoglutarate aldolase
MNIFDEIKKYGIVPVIKIDDEKKAALLLKALIDGGLPVAEVTFRTEAAAGAIKNMVKAFPNALVGAGTILTIEQAKAAKAAGAKFIVSPGLNCKVVEYCLSEGLPIIPGAVTPTEIEAAMELGIKIIKFFPCTAFGGLETIKALTAPYPNIEFMVTGGITESNMREFLAFKNIIAIGGSFMIKDDLNEVTTITRRIVRK